MEDRKSKDDKVSREVWEAVETKARKIRVAKTKRRKKKETEKGENNANKQSSRRIGDLG